jgi:3-oxoadipate enol-lactonase
MQVFADDGARIDATVDGREHDAAVVMIHGFPLTRAIWARQSYALARSFRVISPDLRGAGMSSSPEGPYLMERLAGDVAALLDSLGIERVALIGHSMGGYVVMAFVRMFSERVERLALVASRLRADTPDVAASRQMLADRVEREEAIEPVIDAYLPLLVAAQTPAQRPWVVERAHEIARQNGPAGVAATLRGMAVRSSSEDIAEELDIPALVIAGARDRVVPLDEAQAVSNKFPYGTLVVCDESGHLPMLEEPDRVIETLERWLSS